MKIGVMFGSPETTTGGNALKYYSSVRLDVRRISALKTGDEVIGNRTRVKVVKNKLAPPFRNVEFDIRYGTGIDALGDLLDTGAALGLVEKNGAYFSFEGTSLGQGREKARVTLMESEAMATRLRRKVSCSAAVIQPMLREKARWKSNEAGMWLGWATGRQDSQGPACAAAARRAP